MEDALARKLLDAAPAIVLVLDQKGRVLRTNPFFERLTGYDSAEVIGHDWISEFVPEPSRAAVREAMEQTLGSSSSTHMTNPILTRSGKERIIEWHNRVIQSESSDEYFALALGFDVTERVAAETALRKSEEQLNEAQRLAKIGSWRLDLRDDTLAWSDEIFRIFEIDPCRFAASYEAFLDTIHPDDRETVHRAYSESVRKRKPYEVVHRLRLKSGVQKWVHERGETRYDERGTPLYSTGTVQDITKQVLAQRTLNESQSAYRRLHEASSLKEGAVDATPNAVAFWTFDGTISYVNPAFVHLWGYDEPDELIGRSVLELAADRAEAKKIMANALRGEPIPPELRVLRKNGEQFTVLAATSTLRNEQGRPVQFMGAFIDVTEKKRADEEIRRASRRLRLVVDSSPDWIFAKDLEHRFVLVNETFARAQHRTQSEIIGRLDTELWPSDSEAGDGARRAREMHEQESRVFRGETVHIPWDEVASVDGVSRVFDTWKVPLRDEAGAILGVLCYSRELTRATEATDRERGSQDGQALFHRA